MEYSSMKHLAISPLVNAALQATQHGPCSVKWPHTAAGWRSDRLGAHLAESDGPQHFCNAFLTSP